MLEQFIDFVDSVLPSVDPEAKNKAKEAIKQFDNTPEFLMPQVLEYLSQGDIISEIPFSYYDDFGEERSFLARGMVISTSCHIDQKDVLNIVPLFPIKEIEDDNQRSELKKNRIYDYMYFGEGEMKDYFVDFSKINTYNSNLIKSGIHQEKIQRLFSLNQIGFYFFIIKMTIFFMRKEDVDTVKQRKFI